MTTKIFNAQGQTNNWSDTKNWVGGVVPGSADVALLNGVGPEKFAGPISVGTIMLLGASNVAFDGIVNTSGEAFCRGIMVCNGGTMTFNAGSTLNDLAGSLNIGVHAVGNFIANGSAGRATVINTADALVGQFAQGVGTVTIDDATWNASGTALIGGDGTGSVDVRDGGQVNIGGNLGLAVSNISFGNVTVEAGSTINVTGTAGFGTSQADQASGGVATVTVNAGGTLNIGHWLVEGSTSSLILNGGAVNLGTSGQGWIVLQSGGAVSGHGTLSSMSNVLLDNGLIKAQGGTLEIKSNVSGTGSIDVGTDSTAKLDGSAIQASVIDFTGHKWLAGISEYRPRDISDQRLHGWRQDHLRHDDRQREMAAKHWLVGFEQWWPRGRHAASRRHGDECDVRSPEFEWLLDHHPAQQLGPGSRVQTGGLGRGPSSLVIGS